MSKILSLTGICKSELFYIYTFCFHLVLVQMQFHRQYEIFIVSKWSQSTQYAGWWWVENGVTASWDGACVYGVLVCMQRQLLSSITMFLSSDIPLYHSLFIVFSSCSDPLSVLSHSLSTSTGFCPLFVLDLFIYPWVYLQIAENEFINANIFLVLICFSHYCAVAP